MDTMLAAVFKGNGVLALEERPKAAIQRPDQVLLKVIACGICGSDLHVLHVPPGQDAKPGIIMGHEIYGEVEEAGEEAAGFSAGDPVTVDPNLKCGVCGVCKRGMVNLCSLGADASYGQTIDGGFASYMTVSAKALVKFPKRVKGCVGAQAEPLACALNGIEKLKPSPSDRVLLYGAGPVGLLYMRCLLLRGIRNIIVCDTSAYRREYAQKCGAPVTVDPSGVVMKDFIMDRWGAMANIVIDAVGAGAVMEESLWLLHKGGRFLGFGLNYQARAKVSPAWINSNELQIMGSFLGKFSYPEAIWTLTSEDFHAEQLVSHKFLLTDIQEAFSLAKSQKSSRVIIYPNGFDE